MAEAPPPPREEAELRRPPAEEEAPLPPPAAEEEEPRPPPAAEEEEPPPWDAARSSASITSALAIPASCATPSAGPGGHADLSNSYPRSWQAFMDMRQQAFVSISLYVHE
jgi:hypothetical protein